MAIQYRLIIENIELLKTLFPSLIFFALSFLVIYIPVAVVIGWMDYRKFAVPTDASLYAKASPWTRDLARALTLLSEGRNLEAKKILEKWCG
jgi:hypothetical protein